jgi:DMSO/TMAO reductase YedYZ molybdopterin-dependent catalytic subunit
MFFTALRLPVLAAVAAMSLMAAAATAQEQTLTVVAGGKTTTITAAQAKSLPRARAEARTEQGTINVYEGVLMGELLARAGAPVGPGMRGTDITSYVVATSTDGYTVVFSLTEINPHFTDSHIIVADTVDGQPLPAAQGPWRVIVPKDKYGTRWARQVQKLEVISVKK